MTTKKSKKSSSNRKKLKKLPQSSLGRAAKLGWFSAKFVGQTLKEKLQGAVSTLSEQAILKSQLHFAEDLVSTLSSMKGAAMKAGQMLALDLGDMLPSEVKEVLYRLSDDSSFLEFAQIEKILQRSLGKEKLSQLSDISPEPIAAASIGQVHTGTYKGKKVAIKVQYPGVAKTIDADMFALEKIVRGYLLISGKKLDIKPFFTIAKTKLKQEADYKREARSLMAARKRFMPRAGFRVPEAFPEVSSPRVLVMSFEPGLALKSCIEKDSSVLDPSQKTRLAELLLELLFLEYFAFGEVQTDPNLGNFFFDPDTEELVLLDMGSMQSFPVGHRKQVAAMLAASLDKDSAGVLKMGQALNLVSDKETDAVKADFVEVVGVVAAMFIPGEQPFDFSSPLFLQQTRERIMALVKNIRFTSPAKKFAFLNRKLGGIYHVLRTLEHQHDMQRFWQQIESFVAES